MSSPSRAPRRSAANMGLEIATGVPKPGAATYQAARKSTGLSPSSVPQTKGGSHGSGPSGACYDEYDSMRGSANVGLTPGSVKMNK